MAVGHNGGCKRFPTFILHPFSKGVPYAFHAPRRMQIRFLTTDTLTTGIYVS